MKISDSLYFDYQATTPVDELILQKMIPYFRDKAGNPHSHYHSVGWQSSHAVSEAALNVANLIGADTDEIIFTSGATEANNLALLGLCKREHLGERRRILVSPIEHKCVLAVTRILAEQFGYRVEYLPVDNKGFVSVEELKQILDDDVLIVSIMAVNNEIGTIQDVKGLSQAARNAGAFFHCDAAQAPVAMNLKSVANDVDFFSLSAHKMYGPQGVGILYVSRDLHERIEPLIYGGGQQEGLRSGTVSVPLCVGMGAAAQLMSDKQAESKRKLLRSRRDRFVELLRKLPWDLTLNGPDSSDVKRHPGNANILFHGFSAHDILNTLQPRVAASTGSACSSGIPEPSHVLKAIGLTGDEADASVRFSLGFGTCDDEIEQAVHLIAEALDRISENSQLRSA